ncbi:MAG TPA: ABC transporter permease subunit [Patescibacteria group bacterium]|nr:ABC transporter permease subunit [Patescibacteria group bacterium]
MTALTFRLELRRSRVMAFWLVVIGGAYSGTIGAMYPFILENTALLEEYMRAFPPELMAAFGMTGSLADPGVFFNTYIGNFLWPVLAAIGAILLASRPVAADVERGWAELALGTPLTRVRALGAAIIGQALVLAVLAVMTVGSLLGVGVLVGAGFDATRFMAAAVVLWLFACAIAGATSVVGALTLSRGIAAGVVAGVLIAMYLLNVVAQIQPDLAWLADLGAFKYLTTTELIGLGVVPWTSIAVFGTAAAIGWAASLVVFARRDLLA